MKLATRRTIATGMLNYKGGIGGILAHTTLNHFCRYTLEKQHDHCIMYEDCDFHDDTCDTCATGPKYCSRGYHAPAPSSGGRKYHQNADMCRSQFTDEIRSGSEFFICVDHPIRLIFGEMS